MVTRISIDVLRSARVRREEYVGPWFPEPLLTDPYEDPARSAELADSVSMAALLLLERLSPLERAVFVLREVFGFGFDEVAAAVGRSEAACRRSPARARRRMDVGRGPGDLAALRGLRRHSPRRPRRSCRPWSPGSRSTCCARPASGGRSTSGRGSPSRC